MENNTSESIRVGVVQRAVAMGLALLATSFIFTSVPLVFTAGAPSPAADSRVGQAPVHTSRHI